MDSTAIPVRPIERLVWRATNFLASGRFPAFALFVLLFYQVFVAIMMLAPPATGVWGDFLEDFRVRCFKYDPKSGWMQLSSAWIMLAEPIPLQLILFLIWREPLRELWRTRRRAFVSLAGSGLLLVGVIAVSLLALGRGQARPGELPFPAARLRSALPMPAFTLMNQDGLPVSLTDFKGRVVLVTAVYSTCTTTCPLMLTKVRTVLDQLTPAERGDLAVIAFSLNPEADTRELRAMTARIYSMTAPQFHFVSGVPSEVNALLDRLNFSRWRDEKTGQIQHTNLFFLLDRQGRIAYRLSLSQNEQSWLISALRVLLKEKA